MSFIKDFQKLYWSTPQVQNWTRQSQNCDYGDIIVVSKNCFLCFNSSNLENCYYCYSSQKNYDCGDCMFCKECNQCYECNDSIRCYNCDYVQDCVDCTECKYCYDCKSLNNCFGCVNLYHKKHCIFNKQYRQSEYEKRLEEILTKWPPGRAEKEFSKLCLASPRPYSHQNHNTNCMGDYIYHSKNCYWIFDSIECEDSLYITEACLERGVKDCVDCGPIVNTLEQCYGCCFCGYLNNCSHIYWCDWLADCHWCTNVWDCKWCFGCVYAKNKEYHILNKPYSPKEYEKRVAEHKKELLEAGVLDLYELIHWNG
ncbi:MAG: hypothetical protein WC604_03040 [Candidatus Gracilibacteria bacterium]